MNLGYKILSSVLSEIKFLLVNMGEKAGKYLKEEIGNGGSKDIYRG
jgi:hypothetical protein